MTNPQSPLFSPQMHIAQRHLLPKLLQEHGLPEGQVQLPEAMLSHIIQHYTREVCYCWCTCVVGDIIMYLYSGGESCVFTYTTFPMPHYPTLYTNTQTHQCSHTNTQYM